MLMCRFLLIWKEPILTDKMVQAPVYTGRSKSTASFPYLSACTVNKGSKTGKTGHWFYYHNIGDISINHCTVLGEWEAFSTEWQDNWSHMIKKNKKNPTKYKRMSKLRE